MIVQSLILFIKERKLMKLKHSFLFRNKYYKLKCTQQTLVFA